MKQIIKWWAICLWTILMGACDKIDSDNRWTSGGEIAIPEEDQRTVLVEEYTGQNCINCPQAAAELKKIAKLYPGKVITVAMHALRTGQARPELASEAADAYAAEFQIPSSVPGVMINRQNLGDSKYSQKKALWSSLIASHVNTPALYRIELAATQMNKEKWVDIKVAARTRTEMTHAATDLGIQLWVVEDIRAEQTTPDGKKTDFFHHNVLRGALNGIKGTDYTVGKDYSLQTALPSSVKEIDNSKIVAFLFNKSSKEIYETAIVPLGEGIKDDTGDSGSTDKPDTDDNDAIYFLCNKDSIQSGGNIQTDKIEVFPENKIVEMVSPLIYVKPGKLKGKGPFTLEVSKEDYKGEEFGGLSQICANGSCQDAPSKETFTLEMEDLEESEFIQIHYQIADGKKKETISYPVKIAIKKEEKVLASLSVIFNYNPDLIPEEKPIDPTPEPEPEPEPNPNPDPIVPPVPEPVQKKSNVVVMDFTGQRCTYCIYEIDKLAQFEQEYQDNLIIAAIHNRSYNVDSNFIFDDWQEYATNRVNGYPTLIWNNQTVARASRYIVTQHINKEPVCMPELNAQIKDKRISLSFKATATPGNEQSMQQRQVNVLFWVTESKVMGVQAGEGPNYLHNHILRGHLNGIWGENYPLGTQLETTKDFPKKVLIPQNCELIAIVLDAQTKEFLNAAKVKLQ